MLTADLVQGRRRGDRLLVTPLKGPRRKRALGLAEAAIALVTAHIGRSRGELEEALGAVEVEARDRKLMRGLERLLLQRCVFESEQGDNPIELRAALFSEATRARRRDPSGTLDRQGVLQTVSQTRGLSPESLERRLYADLPDTWRLERFETLQAPNLLRLYDDGQAQAVLLRALQVVVEVQTRDPEPLRQLFRRLKFHRLLWRLERLPPTQGRRPASVHRLIIDGPSSLFASSTRYGLQLALLLPSLDLCDRWSLEAELLWGPRRERLRYTLEGGRRRRRTRGETKGETESEATEMTLPDDVAHLIADIDALNTGWSALPCAEILELPGTGLYVPDLRLVHPDHPPVYVEIMGFWSREAVWKRIELMEAGLQARSIFAVSQRLRVDEAALPTTLPGALYVYKGVIHARRLLEKVEGL